MAEGGFILNAPLPSIPGTCNVFPLSGLAKPSAEGMHVYAPAAFDPAAVDVASGLVPPGGYAAGWAVMERLHVSRCANAWWSRAARLNLTDALFAHNWASTTGSPLASLEPPAAPVTTSSPFLIRRARRRCHWVTGLSRTNRRRRRYFCRPRRARGPFLTPCIIAATTHTHTPSGWHLESRAGRRLVPWVGPSVEPGAREPPARRALRRPRRRRRRRCDPLCARRRDRRVGRAARRAPPVRRRILPARLPLGELLDARLRRNPR